MNREPNTVDGGAKSLYVYRFETGGGMSGPLCGGCVNYVHPVRADFPPPKGGIHTRLTA